MVLLKHVELVAQYLVRGNEGGLGEYVEVVFLNSSVDVLHAQVLQLSLGDIVVLEVDDQMTHHLDGGLADSDKPLVIKHRQAFLAKFEQLLSFRRQLKHALEQEDAESVLI